MDRCKGCYYNKCNKLDCDNDNSRKFGCDNDICIMEMQMFDLDPNIDLLINKNKKEGDK